MSHATKTSHTPGPFRVYTENRMWGRGIVAQGARPGSHFLVAETVGVGDPSNNHEDMAETIANANLFAAAPDLLQACRAALAVLEHTLVPAGAVAMISVDCDDPAVKAMLACGLAIAKAEGGAS